MSTKLANFDDVACPCGTGKSFASCCAAKLAPDQLSRCVLCKSNKVKLVGLWIPEGKPALQMRIPTNRERRIFYALCRTCAKLPAGARCDAVQKIILGARMT